MAESKNREFITDYLSLFETFLLFSAIIIILNYAPLQCPQASPMPQATTNTDFIIKFLANASLEVRE